MKTEKSQIIQAIKCMTSSQYHHRVCLSVAQTVNYQNPLPDGAFYINLSTQNYKKNNSKRVAKCHSHSQ